MLRTAECMGIQHVWVVDYKNALTTKKITRGTEKFLSMRNFSNSEECMKALKETGREIWAFHPGEKSISLCDDTVPVPEKLAIVLGREDEGCSDVVLQVAHRVISFPIFGFSEYYSLSIAAALILQNLLQRSPQARGDMTDEQKAEIRKVWYERLALKSDRRKDDYANLLSKPPPPFPDLRRPDSAKKSSFVKQSLQKRLREKERKVEESIEQEKSKRMKHQHN